MMQPNARTFAWISKKLMKIDIRRVYEAPSKSDGKRILIDRLWPRGISKEKAEIHYWAKTISPSTQLRQWYQHDPEKWQDFKKKYFQELNSNPEGMNELRNQIGRGKITLVFSSKEEKLNNATALKEYLEFTGVLTNS